MGRAKRTNKEWRGIQGLATVESQYQPQAWQGQVVKTMLQTYHVMRTSWRRLELREATSDRCKAEELIPARPWQASRRKRINTKGSLPPTLWFPIGPLLVNHNQTPDGKRCQRSHYFKTSILTLHMPTYIPKNRAGQRSTDLDLENKLVTASMVVLTYKLIFQFLEYLVSGVLLFIKTQANVKFDYKRSGFLGRKN